MASKRITCAPSCARVMPPSGAATKADPSMTRNPDSTPAAPGAAASELLWSPAMGIAKVTAPAARVKISIGSARLMNTAARSLLCVLLLAIAWTARAADAPASAPRAMAEILAQSAPSDWREPDPANTLYVELPGGRAVIELAPAFAPRHVENIRLL